MRLDIKMDVGEGETVTKKEDIDDYVEFWTRMFVVGGIIIPLITMIAYYLLVT